MSTSKSDFVKIHVFTHARIIFFKIREVEVESKIDQTSITHEVNLRTHLGMECCWISVDFGRQVGKENGIKSHQNGTAKKDEKMEGNKMAKKSQQDVPTTRGPRGPDPFPVGSFSIWIRF